MWGFRVVCGVAGLGWLALAGTSAQTAPGAIVGTIRDSGGGVLPGVTVAATAGNARFTAVTDSSGRYRLVVPAGTYRVEGSLAGFRRVVVEAVVSESAKDVMRDLVMRIGPLSIADYVAPAGGIAGALRQAGAVLHLRIEKVVGPRLWGQDENVLMTEHVASIVTVLKGSERGLGPGDTIGFLQDQAGEWWEDGRRHVGLNRPYQPGDEFIALLESDRDGRLHEFIGGAFSFRVTSGRVRWPLEPVPGIQDGMPVEACIEALRKLMRMPEAATLALLPALRPMD